MRRNDPRMIIPLVKNSFLRKRDKRNGVMKDLLYFLMNILQRRLINFVDQYVQAFPDFFQIWLEDISLFVGKEIFSLRINGSNDTGLFTKCYCIFNDLFSKYP